LSYRFDHRTKEQFIKNIKECSLIEHQLMTIYVDWLNSNIDDDNKFFFEDHGIDNTGAFIANSKNVDCRADFVLKRKGKKDKKIDIKFSKQHLDNFHLKVKHIQQYIYTDTCVVNFMGIDTPNPKFCILPPKDLNSWFICGKMIDYAPWGYKPCIRFSVNDIIWYHYKK